jgi:hypothetical protein
MDKKQLELTLSMIPKEVLSDIDKNIILDKTSVLFEFNDFMSKKHNITSEEAENLGKVYVESRAKIGSLDELSSLYKDFAKSEGFIKYDEVTESIKTLMTIFTKLNK